MNEEIFCECGEEEAKKCSEDAKYSDDNMCKCGISKHHYHGGVCGKITQIG